MHQISAAHGALVQEYYDKFGVSEYHKQGKYGDPSVLVYVIDTLDAKNIGLTGLPRVKVETFASELQSERIDVHGDYTTSIIAAPMLSNIPGIAPNSTVWLGDVADVNGDISTTNVVQAVKSAIAKNADIISISLNSTNKSRDMDDAVRDAVDKGILMFASASNHGTEVCTYPACSDGVIAVASVNGNRHVSAFNTLNEHIVLWAPGENYPVVDPDGSLKHVSGTSYSAPFAAGLAALVLADYRKQTGKPKARMTREQMLHILSDNDHLGPLPKSTGYAVDNVSVERAPWWLWLLVILVIVAVLAVVYRRR